MSTRTFLLRLIIPFAVMIIVVVAGSGALISYSGHETARRQQADDLERFTALIERRLAAGATHEDVRADARVLGVRLTLIDATGVVTFDNWADAKVMNNHADRPEVIAARVNGVGRAFRESVTFAEPYVYVARAMGGLVIRCAVPQRPFASLDSRTWLLLALGTALVIGLTTWLALMLLRRLVAPMQRLALAADRMAAGDWRTRVDTSGPGDLRAFSGRLNDVARHAQQQLDDLHQQQSDLTALVDSLPDPILVTDPRQRVILINAPAEQFFQIAAAQALGNKLPSLISDQAVAEVFEHLAVTVEPAAQSYQREIRVTRNGQKMTYQAVAARTGAGGMLLVLRDVSRLAGAVQMKTDFVANASHELRTPIAAIKLAFETLSEVYTDDAQQTRRCMTIIEGHLSRLEDLLRDLLDLSRVENLDLKPQLTETRAEDVAAVVRSTMGPLAADKGVELVMRHDEGLVFTSDRRLMDLVTKNLVENAVKFTPAGGTVTMQLLRDGAGHVLRVIDTGIGIPPQHAERVFERFYQVDAARSGSAGRGTGLGLAIVKHAVHALGGTVSIDSAVGRGTTVTCVFPGEA